MEKYLIKTFLVTVGVFAVIGLLILFSVVFPLLLKQIIVAIILFLLVWGLIFISLIDIL